MLLKIFMCALAMIGGAGTVLILLLFASSIWGFLVAVSLNDSPAKYMSGAFFFIFVSPWILFSPPLLFWANKFSKNKILMRFCVSVRNIFLIEMIILAGIYLLDAGMVMFKN